MEEKAAAGVITHDNCDRNYSYQNEKVKAGGQS